MLLVMGVKCLAIFPQNSNHFFVELLMVLGFFVAGIGRTLERRMLANYCVWLVVLVFIGTGLQKLFHGTYFVGSFLASQADKERFAWFLRLVAPTGDVHKLSSAAATMSPGPYFLRSPLGILASNSIYLAEITCGVLLFSRKGRRFGVLLAFLLVVAIEVVTREVMFGLLLLLGLCVHLPRRAARYWLTATALAEVSLVGFECISGDSVQWFN